LAEFSSVVDAVRCALDVQRGMVERNADVPQPAISRARMSLPSTGGRKAGPNNCRRSLPSL
jgi:hypothetical protein